MSLKHRKDIRSLEVFKNNILDFTKREKIWIQIYATHLSEKHTVSIRDYGVDNSGKLITGKLRNSNPDYILTVDGVEQIIEVKTIPEHSPTYTIKTGAISSCIKHGASILIPKKEIFYLINIEGLCYLYDGYEHKKYYNFSPNDFAVRFLQDGMNSLIHSGCATTARWNAEASVLVEKYFKRLFKNKAT